MLGLGAGNQHQPVDDEAAAIELLRADDVLHGLVAGTACNGGLKVFLLALGQLALRMGEQVGFCQAGGVHQQQLRIALRGRAWRKQHDAFVECRSRASSFRMNAILHITLRKGDAQCIPNAASMLACGAPVRTLARPRSVALYRVSSGGSLGSRVASWTQGSCGKSGGRRKNAGRQYPEVPTVFPYVHKRTARRPRSFRLNGFQRMTRDRKKAGAHVTHRGHTLRVSGDAIGKQKLKLFSELPLSPLVQKRLAAVKFVTPTPVQALAIPPALEGRDVLATAQTGTGKTLELHAADHRAAAEGAVKQITALVLLPTRELAMQVEKVYRQLMPEGNMRAALVVGGLAEGPQLDALRRGVRLVVATPGRLEDFLDRKLVKLDGVEVLVLDECDRMLDMGFKPSIKRIVTKLRADRQTLCYSATLEPGDAGGDARVFEKSCAHRHLH